MPIPLSPDPPRWVLVARILRARGNKGEVAAEILTDFPERLTKLQEVFLGPPQADSMHRRMALKTCWLNEHHRGEEVAGTPLLQVDTSQGELLIPLAVDICTKIDPLARRIDVALPEGLRDLN